MLRVVNPEPRPAAAPTLATEAVRVYQRYAAEVVEAFGLCPWAKRARMDGRVRVDAFLDNQPDDAALMAAIHAVSAAEHVDIGLAVWPNWRVEFDEFRDRVAVIIRELDRDGVSPITLAAFHPDAALDTSNPRKLVPYLRRTPDPTIQVVKRAVIASVTRGPETFVSPERQAAFLAGAPLVLRESTSDQVASTNLESVAGGAAESLATVIADIKADRDAAYASVRAQALASQANGSG